MERLPAESLAEPAATEITIYTDNYAADEALSRVAAVRGPNDPPPLVKQPLRIDRNLTPEELGDVLAGHPWGQEGRTLQVGTERMHRPRCPDTGAP